MRPVRQLSGPELFGTVCKLHRRVFHALEVGMTRQERGRLRPPSVPSRYSPEAEAGLLGCILLDAGMLDEVRDRLPNAGAFHDERHRIAYDGILELARHGQSVTSTTLVIHLTDNEALTSAARGYISGLPEMASNPGNLAY